MIPPGALIRPATEHFFHPRSSPFTSPQQIQLPAPPRLGLLPSRPAVPLFFAPHQLQSAPSKRPLPTSQPFPLSIQPSTTFLSERTSRCERQPDTSCPFPRTSPDPSCTRSPALPPRLVPRSLPNAPSCHSRSPHLHSPQLESQPRSASRVAPTRVSRRRRNAAPSWPNYPKKQVARPGLFPPCALDSSLPACRLSCKRQKLLRLQDTAATSGRGTRRTEGA